MEKIKYNVPPEMLSKCQWFHPIEAPTTQALAEANKINAERFEECYYQNNAKAEFLEKISAEASE